MNDWVPAIRWVAAASLPYLLADAEPGILMAAMPCFDKLLRSERCQQDFTYKPWELYPMLARRFAECPKAVFRQPVHVRRLCYQTIFLQYQENYDTKVQRTLLRCWMDGERDNVQHDWLVTMYLRWCKEEIPQSELIPLTQSKRWRIRYHACERRYRQEGLWDGFEVLLLDTSSAVRAFAAYWLSRAGFDCVTYCRSHRPEGIPLLGELGTKADIPYVRQYLKEQPCMCLYALVRLGAEDTEALLWEHLHSVHPAAARTAFRIAWAQHIRFSRDTILAELETVEDPILRWRLVKLLGIMGDWQVLPALIRLVNDYSHLRTDILHAIENRYPWQQSLSPELARQIEQAIAEVEEILPETLVQQLR
ncbi:MAG: hypothetical protein K2I93_08630, partial [Oscillospiraceae bacterium]|nr:hypothetical protein [Oscillospiraceae bacterium]